MRRPTVRRIGLLGCLLATVMTSTAHAADITVDDDRAQCPTAEFTSLPEAVATAAQYDTIYVCAGTYGVSSAGTPSSAGLKIEKNLSIIGAGADLVTIQPGDPGTWTTATTPNERDDFGNVITVKRRLVELVEVRLSGFTVRANGAPVEAGIAIIDVIDAQLSGIRVEGITAAPGTGAYEPGVGPVAGHGYGIIAANTLQAQSPDEPYTHRVVISGSKVSGYNKAGIVVDGRTPSGTAVANAAFLATIQDSTVTGSPTAPIGQDGIQVWGTDAVIERNEITDNGNPTPGTGPASAAILLRGAGSKTVLGGQQSRGNNLYGNRAYGIFRGSFADATTELAGTPTGAKWNWWGPMPTPNPPGAPSASPVPRPSLTTMTNPPRDYANSATVNWSPAADAKYPTPALAPVADAAPTVAFDRPRVGSTATPGTPVLLSAVADDDFGVAGVSFEVDGVPVGGTSVPDYEALWTPVEEDRGSVKTLTAIAVDSAGQETETTRTITVPALPVEPTPTPTPEPSPEPTATPPAVVDPPAPDPTPVPVSVPVPTATPAPVAAADAITAVFSKATRTKLTEAGNVRARFACPVPRTTTVCTGTIRVSTVLSGKTITVSSRFSLPSGIRAQTFLTKLSPSVRREIRRRGRITVKVRLVGTAGDRAVTGSKTLTVVR